MNFAFRRAGAFDQGVPGKYNASHAEPQMLTLGKTRFGVSKPMCSSCQRFAQAEANRTGVTIKITDPVKTNVFTPTGSTLSILKARIAGFLEKEIY